MKAFMKTAAVAGVAGVLALASMTPSEARSRGWGVAAGIGLAGAAIATAAAASNYGYYGYYGPGYAYEPYYAEPAYSYGYAPGYATYGYSPGYSTYAYSPGYRTYRHRPGYSVYGYSPGYSAYGYAGDETRTYPPHYDPGYGYNSNTTAPWRDRTLQGKDY
jgi:hypothetical protein